MQFPYNLLYAKKLILHCICRINIFVHKNHICFMNLFFRNLLFSYVFFFCTNVFAQRPQTPIVDSLSVDIETNQVVLAWHITDNSNIDGFKIYRKIFGYGEQGVIDGANMPIADIQDANTTFFRDTTQIYGDAMPQKKSEKYYVAAYKIITKDSLLYSIMSIEQNTIRILQMEYDFCTKSNNVSWNKYNGWSDFDYDSLYQYKIFFKKSNADNFIEAGTVNAPDTVFIHNGVEQNTNYNYFIRAIHANETKKASSPISSTYTETPKLTQNIDIDYITVNNNNKLEISGLLDANAQISHFALLRSENNANSYDTIAIFDKGMAEFNFVDTSANVAKSYKYYLSSIDICQNEDIHSQIYNNTILLGSKISDKQNYISWLNHNKIQSDSYRINLLLPDGRLQLLQQQTDTVFTHNTEMLTAEEINQISNQGNFCYIVQFDIDTQRGEQLISTNTVCLPVSLPVYIPTAINPVSYMDENRYFKPKIEFAKNYLMIIYNRAGNKIFESNSINSAWDGRINGRCVPQGTYAYYIKFIDADNNHFEKKGYFSVIYP